MSCYVEYEGEAKFSQDLWSYDTKLKNKHSLYTRQYNYLNLLDKLMMTKDDQNCQ